MSDILGTYTGLSPIWSIPVIYPEETLDLEDCRRQILIDWQLEERRWRIKRNRKRVSV